MFQIFGNLDIRISNGIVEKQFFHFQDKIQKVDFDVLTYMILVVDASHSKFKISRRYTLHCLDSALSVLNKACPHTVSFADMT